MEDPSGIQRTLTNKQVRKNAGDNVFVLQTLFRPEHDNIPIAVGFNEWREWLGAWHCCAL